MKLFFLEWILMGFFIFTPATPVRAQADSPPPADAQAAAPVQKPSSEAADAQQAAVTEMRNNQTQIMDSLEKLNRRMDSMQENIDKLQTDVTSVKRPALSDIDKAQQMYVEGLTQGGSFWERTGFKVNADGTATLTGSGTAVLNSESSSNNAGNGAQLYMTFTDLQDPLFKKCRPLLEKSTPSTSTSTLEVFGLGSYESDKADPKNPGNITSVFAFRLSKLTKCNMRKL